MQNARACLYHATREMSDALELKRGFYLHAKILLNDTNLLNQVVAEEIRGKGTSAGTAGRVLQHVLHRTLPYNKLVEHITVKEIQEGMVTLAIPSAGGSERTVRRALNVLVQEGYLIRMEASIEQRRVYGLNLPFIVRKIAEYMDKGKVKPNTTAGEQKKRCSVIGQICNRLQPWYDHLKEIGVLALYRLDEILAELKAWCGRNLNLMGTARQMIKSGQEKAQEAKVRRLRKQAEKPLVYKDSEEEKTTVKPRQGLDYWRLMLELRKDKYHGGIPIPTGKTIGQMKHWLKELAEVHEMPDDEIKAWIEDIVEHWSRIKGWNFQTGEKGYHRTVPDSPDFPFYYAHRRELDPRIKDEIEVAAIRKNRPVKKSSGKSLMVRF